MMILLLQHNIQIESYINKKKHDYTIISSINNYYDCKDFIDENPPSIVFFDGGDDVSPIYYKEDNLGLSSCDPERDSFESEIFRIYRYLTNTRFAGICRGSQFLNVMFGGTLHQDIPQRHSYYHPVLNLGFPNLPDTFRVNSTHHQGVKELAPGLNPLLIEPMSGITEGFCDAECKKVKAVQSHPEFLDGQYPLSLVILDWLFKEA